MQPILPALLVALTAAPPLALAAQQPRSITPPIELDFGGMTTDPAAELIAVRDVIRLDDGRFVVVNGKPSEVRVYDARGAFRHRISRQGGGPGEYQYGVVLRPATGDTVRLWSLGAHRWLVFTAAGRLVKEWSGSDRSPAPVRGLRLYGSAVLDRGVVGSAGCPAAALARYAPRSAKLLSEAVADPVGRLWLRPFGAESWTVYASTGAALARVAVPAMFRITQFVGDRVVGVRTDDDGFSHVVTFRTGLPSTPRATGSCDALPQAVPPVRGAEIKTAVRNAMTAAEAYYSRHRHYPTRADDYPDGVKPDGTEFTVQRGGASSFAVMITDVATGWRCLVSVGDEPLLDGALLCGS